MDNFNLLALRGSGLLPSVSATSVLSTEIRDLEAKPIPRNDVAELGDNHWSFPHAATNGEKSVSAETAVAFVASISWVGKVDSVDNSGRSFNAILTSQNSPDEYACIDFDEISDDDFHLLKPGAIFYWSIGQSVNESGRKVNESTIRFRRLRHWTRGEVERSKEGAKKFNAWLAD